MNSALTYRRSPVGRALDHALDPLVELAALGNQLDAAYRRTAANMATNPAVRVARRRGRDHLVLTQLERLDEPASLRRLRAGLDAQMPHADLPEVLQEIQLTITKQYPSPQTGVGGELASVDGLRFKVPVKPLNAGYNPRYFGVERGATWLNMTSGTHLGLHGVVVPGTLRDSGYILEVALEQPTSLRPSEIVSDTAGYADVVFGIFALLGYQFSPRLADLGELRLWRLDPKADCGALDGVARHPIKRDLIVRHWDDLLRVAGSLTEGTLLGSAALRMLQSSGRYSMLGRAVAEYGRIAKSLFLLSSLDDERYRRRVLHQINWQEGRHRLARAVFYGQKGELRQHYREGKEDQLRALGFVPNLLVLWNTRYTERILAHMRSMGMAVRRRRRG